MNLETIIKKIGSNYWINDIDELVILLKNYSHTKNEFKLVTLNIAKNTKKKRIGKTLNWLVLGLILNQEKTIHYLTRNGIFRIANFNYNVTFLKKIHESIFRISKDINLTPVNHNFFRSKTNFLLALTEISTIYYAIKTDLERHKKTIFKDLLAIADFYFLYNIERKQKNDPSKLDFYTKEEITESISFVLYNILRINNFDPNCINRINEKNIINNKYTSIIINSCLLKKCIEYEILIDSFGYQCDGENKIFNVKASDPFLEQSIQHGWIYTVIQQTNSHINTISQYKDKALSLETLCDKIYEKIGDQILIRKKEPIERLVLQIPEYPPIFDLLAKDDFFLEEIAILSEECKEMFIAPNEILDFKVKEDLTFKDILIIHRIFSFLRIIFSKYLDKHLKDEPEIVFRSLLPVYKKNTLVELFERFIGKEKSKYYLDLFTWDKENNDLFDLQYRPIIKIKDHYILPTNILCKSNVFRNTLYIIRKRLWDKNKIDPIANILEKSIKKQGYSAKTNVEYKKNGFKGDIDLIAQIGGTTFICEAKNTLLPGNLFELRTTYDNLLKAKDQLTKFKQATQSPDFAEYLSKKVGWEITADTNICTCIVLSNRLFSGYKIQGHPVRSIFELAHFINEGKIKYHDGNKYDLWDGANFQEQDLLNYLVKDNFHKLHYEIMTKMIIPFPIKNYILNMHSYFANYESFSAKLQKAFQYTKIT